MAQIDKEAARAMRDALGPDLDWRLAYANDQRYLQGDKGHWHEGYKAQPGVLRSLSDQLSWHLRPMPVKGPYQLTMLDDATQETIDRIKSEGLPPTAVVQTSENRYQVWHRWPDAMGKEQTQTLLEHLQSHFGTDSGANMAGHCGRLAGSRNWKRKPEKGIDRGGCPVILKESNPPLSKEQAAAWLERYPVPEAEPPKAPPVITLNNAKIDEVLASIDDFWMLKYGKELNASSADASVAAKLVGLGLDDASIAGILGPYLTRVKRAKKGPGYIACTIEQARDYVAKNHNPTGRPRSTGKTKEKEKEDEAER